MEEESSFLKPVNIPGWLEGICIGSYIKLRPNMDEWAVTHAVRCGWSSAINRLAGSIWTVNQEMWDRIVVGCETIFTAGRYSISLDMLEFAEPPEQHEPEPEPVVEDDFDSFSLERGFETSIIDEMISKVDIHRFKKLLVIGTQTCGTFTVDKIKQPKLDFYLQEWARAKYPFYKLFGNKLKISSYIDEEVTESMMSTRVNQLQRDFPQYCVLLAHFRNSEFKSNSIECSSSTLERFCQEYQRGTKVTKFLANLLKDQKFNDALAHMMTDRTVKSPVSVSVDPYDYLTMSVNQHDWDSCHSIVNGSRATGPLSLMIDPTSVVTFKHGDKDYLYNFDGLRFEGNSKSWREMAYVDKNTSSIIFSRQYPNQSEVVCKAIRNLLEKEIAEYIHKEDKWYHAANSHRGYMVVSDCMYHDMDNGYDSHQVYHKNFAGFITKRDFEFPVGRDIICLNCGDTISEHSSSFLCRSCQ